MVLVIDPAIMSRVPAVNGGATRSSEGRDLLEIEGIVGGRVWRGSPGVCAIVDASWTSSARQSVAPGPEAAPGVGRLPYVVHEMSARALVALAFTR
jgi:hypothetical protein